MLVQHNIPIALANEMTPLFRDVFLDSEIAKRYASRHTKTTCLINGALAPHYQQELVAYMKENPYALAIDGSSDNSIEMNPLTVRIFDQVSGTVCTRFLDMCMSSEANAEAIFSKMEAALAKHGISWDNCVGISLDNTSAWVAITLSRLEFSMQTQQFTLWDVLVTLFITLLGKLIVHLKRYSLSNVYKFIYIIILYVKVSKFNVEEMVIDLYYWFDKSTKRKANLQRYCVFCDTNYRDIIKHVSTRWLSLEKAINCTLQQYKALRSYYISEGSYS